MPDWHAAWVFLELHRSGSFRACARRLTMTLTSIRRHIDRLEAAVGLPLLTRHVDGIRLTPEGEELVRIAARMEQEAIKIVRLGDARADELDGAVRIAVTEGLGAAWLAPHLRAFQATHDRLRIDLVCGMTSADVLRMEADLAVQLTRPQAPDVKVVRLGYLHIMPYASAGYLAEHGTPRTVTELATHRLAIQLAEQASTGDILGRIFGTTPFTGRIAVTTNVSSAHTLAIANGVGIGWLPTYVTPAGSGLVPLDCGADARIEIWLTYHPDAERMPRVRSAIEWIRSIFDARRFPAFGERRISPNDLQPHNDIPQLRSAFREFVS